MGKFGDAEALKEGIRRFLPGSQAASRPPLNVGSVDKADCNFRSKSNGNLVSLAQSCSSRAAAFRCTGDDMAGISEGLGVLALAADAATGRPQGTGLSAAIVATEFARRIGESEETQKDAYYLALVRFIGCTITSHETGMLSIGDDQGFAVATMLGDWADREDLKMYLNRFIAHEAP